MSPNLERFFATVPRAVAIGVLPFLVACGGGGATPDEIAQGHDEFKKICSSCHGQNGEGMPRLGKDLHDNEFVKSKSDEELLTFILEGRSATHPDNTQGVDMPPRGGSPTLTDAQIQQIIAYMRSLK